MNTPRTVLMAHPGTEMYGSDRVLLDSASSLADLGWHVTVVLPDRGPLRNELEARGVTTEECPMPVLRKRALRPRGAIELAVTAARSLPRQLSLLRRTRPDVVYVSTVTIPSWLLVPRLTGRRVVCHVHEAETGASRLIRTLLAAPLLAASRIVVNSEFSLEVLVRAVGRLRRRAEVVLNPVDGPPVTVPPRASLDAPVRLLYMGRLSERKGPQVAVAALAELHRRGLDSRLDLLGAVFEGYEWFETQLRDQVAEAGLVDAVDFLGFSSDVWPTVERDDVVLVPSVVDEPFGNTAVEAVLAARPVVVSRSGGLTEAVAGYGSARVAAPDDATALADAVADIVADWPDMSDAAVHDAAVAADRHSRATYASRLDAVLISVSSSTRSADSASRRRT